MNTRYIIGIIAGLALASSFFWWQSKQAIAPAPGENAQERSADTTTTPASPSTSTPSAQTTPPPSSASNDTGMLEIGTVVKVVYTEQGFIPKNMTVKKGDTVQWVNESSHTMWVAAARHPDHTSYSGTALKEHCPDENNSDFDQCASVEKSDTYTFTFDKTGTWNYHNHVRANDFGSVVVQN